VKKLATLMFLVIAFALAANANTVTIQFLSTGGNSYNGVYTYPYYGTVNGMPQTFMCDSFNEHIFAGETWTAYAFTVPQYGAWLGSLQEADELAYVYNLIAADHGSKPWENAVAWNIKEGAPALTLQAQTLETSVEAMTFASGYGSNDVVYVPDPPPFSTLSLETPQTFWAVTPEPSTLLLVGSGLLVMGNIWRRIKA